MRLEFADAAFYLFLGSRPRAVGKRTPRFPVSYSYDKDNGQKYFSPSRQVLKLKVDSVDDDVAHEVALALAKASQRGGSPQVSQTPNRRRIDNIRLSPVQNGERMVIVYCSFNGFLLFEHFWHQIDCYLFMEFSMLIQK